MLWNVVKPLLLGASSHNGILKCISVEMIKTVYHKQWSKCQNYLCCWFLLITFSLCIDYVLKSSVDSHNKLSKQCLSVAEAKSQENVTNRPNLKKHLKWSLICCRCHSENSNVIFSRRTYPLLIAMEKVTFLFITVLFSLEPMGKHRGYSSNRRVSCFPLSRHIDTHL